MKCNVKRSNLTNDHCQNHTQIQSINLTNNNLTKYLSSSHELHIFTTIKSILSSIAKTKVIRISSSTSISIIHRNNFKLVCLVILKNWWKIAGSQTLMNWNLSRSQHKVYLTLSFLSFWERFQFSTSHNRLY